MSNDKDTALKEPTWKHIKPQTLQLGNNHYHCEVQDEGQFSREAQFHPSCCKSRNLNYTNHWRDSTKITNCNITDINQDHKANVNQRAFTAEVVS